MLEKHINRSHPVYHQMINPRPELDSIAMRSSPHSRPVLVLTLAGTIFTAILTSMATDLAFSDQTLDHAFTICRDMPPTASAECMAAIANEIGDNRRAESALSVQSQIAAIACWSVIITALMTVLTGLSLWFIRKTLDATRQLAEDTRSVGEAQVRAYMVITISGGIVQAGYDVRFELEVKNIGNSPAYNVGVISDMRFDLQPTNPSALDVSPGDSENPGTYLPPEEAIGAFIDSFVPIHLSSQDEHNLRNEDAVIRGAVAVYYQDVFGQSHKDEFHFEFAGPRCFARGVPKLIKRG